MSVHPFIRRFVDVYELDAEGNRITTCEGYKLTARCDLKQHQSRATRYKGCEPFGQPPPDYLVYPNKPHGALPQVH
ncbi:hypothetical protein EWM64_g7609 [Hericium alpestre]|nr:hypothetical protein EWM64_g7609 [Hericium alpestre]